MTKTLTNATPLELTQTVRDISVTERATFKTCRRRWELEVLDNLAPRVPPALDLDFGSGIHKALEAFYMGRCNQPALPDTKKTRRLPLTSALMAWDEHYSEVEIRLDREELPEPTVVALQDQWVELGDLGEEILRGYFQYAKEEDRFTIHAIEGQLTPAGKSWLKKHWEDREHNAEHSLSAVTWHGESNRLLVPILHPRKQTPLKRGPVLSARIDLLVNRIDTGMKGWWIYDHKTTTSSPNDRGLDFDDQATAYCYAVWRWLGIVPRGVCFNYLVKQAPKSPRILKKGQLSTAKDQLTTAQLYHKEMVNQGLVLKDGTITSDEHAEAYESLLSHGWDRFFQRHYALRNRQELVHFEERLYDEYQDMLDGYNGDLALYPNHDRRWCPGCSVAPICRAMEDGSDVEGIISSRYEEAPDRKAAA